MRHILACLLLTYPLHAAPSTSINPVPPEPKTVKPAETSRLDLTGVDDNLTATKRTKAFLTKLGYQTKYPTSQPTDGIWITDTVIGLTVRALADKDGIDRLVISCGVPGKGLKLHENLEALQALSYLNSNYNTCTIILTEHGDVGFCTSLNFSDTLDAKVLREHIEYLLGVVTYFITTDEPATAAAMKKLVK